ncbi:MAG TPA: ribosome-associated translation inhibitor RaiA [Candidatus Syntrophosphaera sp.]|jgi:putative sigma-54 modulation protein|nr:ribosome-associated translation inhibitor RaiA [Candidatus Cloacimonadota bacterium]OQB92500.1 MAG: putative sigma-54 modulation protein [Candidatus Cloacimonetes bacterium ADurb.Bin117]HNU53726.1 ribosome-associated translation inhibitor RaiA [Candidatus Syntrophosphaera sp.]MDI9524223.1 ribosome-associated translation inhibitor RaiA [Candidatus Cloacimonadota bacterium]MDI9528349.1 ribosome-associated translation inhibitor RaiA [Candidatus Cloacimonadota bacterium]
MQITITARRFELTKAIRDYVESSCLKINRYFDNIINVHVTLSLENSRNICEISLQASKFGLQSQAEEMDMYLSIDNALDKMEAQIKKLKDRVTDHQKRALKDQFSEFSRETDFLVNPGNRDRKTVKTKRAVAEMLTVEEAMAKIETQKDEFLIFKNVETDRLNVLVKRDEQNYKLFEP